MESKQPDQGQADRRTFLTNFGKAAVVAPPVVTALLSTSLSSPAIAASAGGVVSARRHSRSDKRNAQPAPNGGGRSDGMSFKTLRADNQRKPRGPGQ